MIRKFIIFVCSAILLTAAILTVLGLTGMEDQYRSTERSCLRLSVRWGVLYVRFDCGADVFQPRTVDFSLAGLRVLTSAARGWHYAALDIPLWMPAAPAAILLALVGLHGPLRERRRRTRGQCVRCGYDLRGSRSARCPECGAAADAHAGKHDTYGRSR